MKKIVRLAKRNKKLLAGLAVVAAAAYAVKKYGIPYYNHMKFKQENPDLPGSEK